jgi:hypothetical protein
MSPLGVQPCRPPVLTPPTNSAPPHRALIRYVAFASRRSPVSPSYSSTIVTRLCSASRHAPLLQAPPLGATAAPSCATASTSIGAAPRAKSATAQNCRSHPSPPSSSQRSGRQCRPSSATLQVGGCRQELHLTSTPLHEPTTGTNDHCTMLPSSFPPPLRAPPRRPPHPVVL